MIPERVEMEAACFLHVAAYAIFERVIVGEALNFLGVGFEGSESSPGSVPEAVAISRNFNSEKPRWAVGTKRGEVFWSAIITMRWGAGSILIRSMGSWWS